MRVNTPRIAPLAPSEYNADQAAFLKRYVDENRLLNIHATIARIPKAARGFIAYGDYLLRESDLSLRQRELAILRTGWLCKSGYEFTQHKRVAMGPGGLSEAEVQRLKTGPDAEGWAPEERAILRAADELLGDHFISDATWRQLGQSLSDRQRMELVMLVGQFTQVCMMLNTWGVQLEPDRVLEEGMGA